MANISITLACNRDCAFCFARAEAVLTPGPSPHMPLPRFEAALDFLARSGIPEARLLGGEPTLHPEFGRIVDMVASRGASLVLFSGGIIPEAALKRLESLPASSVSILINTRPPLKGRPLEPARLDEVCRRLGTRAMLGVTIDSPSIRLDPLVDAIDAYGLHRRVRLGLAQPSAGNGHAYLHPRHYAEVGRRVAAFAAVARRRGVGLEFDCGWVPCMFPDGDLDPLGPAASGIGRRCGPVLDLLPDGRFVSCYPLSGLGTLSLGPGLDAARARSYFEARRGEAGPCFIQPECDTCDRRLAGSCGGGCLSAALLRRRPWIGGRHATGGTRDC